MVFSLIQRVGQKERFRAGREKKQGTTLYPPRIYSPHEPRFYVIVIRIWLTFISANIYISPERKANGKREREPRNTGSA